MTRPETIVPGEVTSPYPIYLESKIISGFGRGSAELGIPTANIPINDKLSNLETGIYYGWCRVEPDCNRDDTKNVRNDGNEVVFNHGNALTDEELAIFPMVMSIGWNPFYQNKEKAAEVHIMHKFKNTFYGATIHYNLLGYIRPELNYTTKEALIEDINLDIQIALEILNKDSYLKYKIL